MDLSEQQIARLYKLTLEVRRALRRDVTPTAILHVIIGLWARARRATARLREEGSRSDGPDAAPNQEEPATGNRRRGA
jgi:hypothetical protein